MTSRLRFLLFYFITWVLFFELLRLVFLIYHSDKTALLSPASIAGVFWHGLRMDISASAYILMAVCLFTLFSLYFSFFRQPPVFKVFTYIVLLIVSFVSLCDLGLYRAWGFRIDSTPLQFINTPREALASVSHMPLLAIAAIFILCYLLFCLGFRLMIDRFIFHDQPKQKAVKGLLLLFLTGVMIIPVRGGFQLAPLNQSGVYFSVSNFANHAAVNASWNFMHSLFGKVNSSKNPYQYLSPAEAESITKKLYSGKEGIDSLISTVKETPVNVLLIICESFTEKATSIRYEGKEVMPGFNSLKKEGIYFSNVYASGDRTNKGVSAILSGYPALPKTSIIYSPSKSVKLSTLPQLFLQKGYAAPFFYGGEPEFANIKSYLLQGGFQPIVGRNDFSRKDMNSKWGAHDGVVAARVLSDLSNIKQPFFTTWLTLSSHEPFETPTPPIFVKKDITSRFLNSLHYTDQVLTDFVRQCAKQPWWNNTLIIITGDHGHPLPETGKKADDFRIPMLWTGGTLTKRGIVIDKIISQLDIAAMLCSQLKMPAGDFPFSKNSLDSGIGSWAFFTFNDGFGIVDSSARLVYDNVGNQVIQLEGSIDSFLLKKGKALMQYTFEDFIKK